MSKNNKILEFPNAKQLPKQEDLEVNSINEKYSKLVTGEWSYNCPSCDTKISFSSEGMVFRLIETFCGNCGHLHRIVNPAFSKETPKYKLK